MRGNVSGEMFVHLSTSGQLSLISAISGDTACVCEPPHVDLYRQHIGVFVGDEGKYMASAHDGDVFVWKLEGGITTMLVHLKSHRAPILKVRTLGICA
jgi:hypothetical protein